MNTEQLCLYRIFDFPLVKESDIPLFYKQF